jgi:predicted transposase YdaD
LVIRIWEQDSALFIKNKALLPLAPLTRTDSPQRLLSQVAEEIAKIPNRETKQNIVGYTGILAGLRLDKDFIRQLLSEDIMQDSVIYQDILQKGEQRGEKRGEQRGEQREAFRFLNRQINKRFGEVNSSIIERIRVLPTEQLEILGEEFLDFSDLADLCNWLDLHSGS